ncbi:hypothetical protein OSG_eHP30_00055 [environmental Halophage eHP-30]|nr:hypothetical protein OSG_eHP30_00055 [environmental Halophage eHP-30]
MNTEEENRRWLDSLYLAEGNSHSYDTAYKLLEALKLFYKHGMIEEPEYERKRQEVIDRIKRQIANANAQNEN